MTKVAIITDSSCDLTPEIIGNLPIKIIPLRILFEETEYKDRVDIQSQEIYEKMRSEIPTTSLPAAADIIKVIENLKNQGYTDIIGIFISSGLSGTFNVAKTIAESYNDQLNITIIDSLQVSMGLGYMVLDAANRAVNNESVEEIMQEIINISDLIKVDFVVGTLKYLKKGGRIGHLSGTIGEMLQVKPILTIRDGSIETIKKVNGRKKSIKALIDIIEDKSNKDLTNIIILHADAREEAEKIREQLNQNHPQIKILVISISAVVGVHTGPGLIGIARY